jgi:hypothetical protein
MPSSSSEQPWLQLVLDATGAAGCQGCETVQGLWSGYGQIVRCTLDGGSHPTVVVKHVRWPDKQTHPRGWSGARSHARKARSYDVELCWYQEFSQRALLACRLPYCLAGQRQGNDIILVLEDLNAAGYALRPKQIHRGAFRACVEWLAHLHATFMQCESRGLWPVGTYWHLDTRPDELEVLRRRLPELAEAAAILDQRLRAGAFQTLVHGDAKVANFCFSNDGKRVAAVDFQYAGGGCGMKDLAYFVGSCLDEDACEKREEETLALYFYTLRTALAAQAAVLDLDALEAEWRVLYPIAWTDFYRFLEGWSPGHWKSNGYARKVARRVLADL